MKSFLLAALVSSLAILPAFSNPMPRGPVLVKAPAYAIHQAGVNGIWQCTAQERAAYLASGLPQGDSIKTVEAINKRVKKMVRYRREKGDQWRDVALQVLSGQRAEGDCEDFAITAITMALCAGIPAEKIGLALSGPGAVSKLTNINHALAFYESDGVAYSFADTRHRGVRHIRPGSHGIMMWQTVERLRAEPEMFTAVADKPTV